MKTIAQKMLLVCALLPAYEVLAQDGELEKMAKITAIQSNNSEETYSWHISTIKAQAAWDKGVAGKGVKVGVLDTGVYNHSEFGRRLLAGYDFTNNKAIRARSNSDDQGHGTHVAGLVAADAGTGYSVGAAPLASIVPIKVLNSEGFGSFATIVKGLDYSRSSGARILNLSLSWGGGGVTEMQAALQRNVKAGQLVVVAAGNNGLANPEWPARYAKDGWANGQIIAVGAVDKSNAMAGFSNRAGDTASYYLVAPGVNLLSADNLSSSYIYMSGTSMATPVVAGAAALLTSYWPTLPAKSVANILFQTATDLGEPGVDAIYGRGLVNVEKALQPIGTPTVTTQAGSTFKVGSYIGSVSIAYANALSQANLTMAATDDYGRDYQYDLADAYKRQGTTSLPLFQVFSGMDARLRMIETMLDGARLTMTQISPPEMASAWDGTGEAAGPLMLSMSYTQTMTDQNKWSFGINASPNLFFGLAGTPFEMAGFMANRAFSNPYLSFNGYHNYAGYGWALRDGLTLSAGVVNATDALAMQGNNTQALTGRRYDAVASSGNAMLMELAQRWDDAKLGVSLGSSMEKDGMLGGSPGAMFGMRSGARTDFFALSGALRLRPDIWVAGSYYTGVTHLSAQTQSLLEGASGVRSESWSLGLIRTDTLMQGDRLGFALSQPLATTSGSLALTAPIGLNEVGVMQYEQRAISLNSSGLERDVEASYFRPTGASSGLSLSAMVRINPGHDSSAEMDKLIAARWMVRF